MPRSAHWTCEIDLETDESAGAAVFGLVDDTLRDEFAGAFAHRQYSVGNRAVKISARELRLVSSPRALFHDEPRMLVDIVADEWQRGLGVAASEKFIREAFLAANLSAPGGWRAERIDITDWQDEISVRLIANSALIGAADARSRLNAPPLQRIALQRICEWLETVAIADAVVAVSSAQKALAAVLHVAQMELGEPAALLWITQALEALYNAPTALTFNVVSSRSIALLGIKPCDHATFTKALRKLYDARNAFVHGGGPVVLPRSERLASWFPKLQESEKVVEAVTIGLQALVATLQVMAEKNWTELRFVETASGRTA